RSPWSFTRIGRPLSFFLQSVGELLLLLPGGCRLSPAEMLSHVPHPRSVDVSRIGHGADGQGPTRVTPGRPAQGKRSWSSVPSVRPRSTWAAALMQVPAPSQKYARHQVARQQ